MPSRGRESFAGVQGVQEFRSSAQGTAFIERVLTSALQVNLLLAIGYWLFAQRLLPDFLAFSFVICHFFMHASEFLRG